MIERAMPKMVVSDNGSELTSNAISCMGRPEPVSRGTASRRPDPCKKAFIESFKYRPTRGYKR